MTHSPALQASCREAIGKMHREGMRIRNDFYPCELFEGDIAENQLYVRTEGDTLVSGFALCGVNSREQAVSRAEGICREETGPGVFLNEFGYEIKL